MKAILSVLLSDLRGKAGNVVASAWKGINYFREHVIPANPNTAAQQTQRACMTRGVAWWHDIEAQVQDECKRLVAGLPLSGFNGFIKRNVKDMADSVDLRIIPLNADVLPIGTLAAATGAGLTKEIDLTFAQGEAVAADELYIIACTYFAGALGPALSLIEKETTNPDAGTLTITMPTADEPYMVYVLVEHPADSTFSVALCDDAVSKL